MTSTNNWKQLMESVEFKRLITAKSRFIWPILAFSYFYYFLLPVCLGYFKPLMTQKLLGPINVAYFFAISQFFVVWGITWFYSRTSSNLFDPLVDEITKKTKGIQEKNYRQPPVARSVSN